MILLGLLAACGEAPEDTREQDILAAVQIYLREERGLNPDAMKMEIAEVSFDGDQARAVIKFASPDLGQEMRFEYWLERHEHNWKVVRSSGDGSHGRGGALPEGHPAVPDTTDPQPETPPASG